LESEEGTLPEEDELRRHIEGYYKNLFGREERGQIRLSDDLWGEEGILEEEEARKLVEPFLEKEIKRCFG
jgi:hypothetical protein